MGQNVAILGASQKPDRYAYKAFKMLTQYGHQPFPVSRNVKEVEGIAAVTSVLELKTPIDTLTMYVGPDISTGLQAEILKLAPKRVIFNPGTENPALENALKEAKIEVIEACTLVMLKTNQF